MLPFIPAQVQAMRPVCEHQAHSRQAILQGVPTTQCQDRLLKHTTLTMLCVSPRCCVGGEGGDHLDAVCGSKLGQEMLIIEQGVLLARARQEQQHA
jgi:hypothetical protein